MSNLFNKLELEAFRAGINPRTQESRDWFRRRVQQLRRIDRRALMQEEPISEKKESNPLFDNPTYMDKMYRNVIMKMNQSRSQTDSSQ